MKTKGCKKVGCVAMHMRAKLSIVSLLDNRGATTVSHLQRMMRWLHALDVGRPRGLGVSSKYLAVVEVRSLSSGLETVFKTVIVDFSAFDFNTNARKDYRPSLFIEVAGMHYGRKHLSDSPAGAVVVRNVCVHC